MEKKIVLLPSKQMDANKKAERNEQELIRMPKFVRSVLEAEDSDIEIAGETAKTLNLSVFKAFSEDLKSAMATLSVEALSKVCFVTTDNFNSLGGTGKPFIEISASNTFLSMLIGTDPELLLMKEGEVINASNVLTKNKTAKFGADGAMAELRPSPAKTPEDLVNNIRAVLHDENNIKGIDKYDWVSACYIDKPAGRDYPVGMHIHIDNPHKIAKLDINQRLRLFSVTNKILDELLTLPLIRLDGKEGHSRRARCKMSTHNGFSLNKYGKGYGFFGEWRVAYGRLEHRSLSGLVLSRPDLCRAVFGTAKAIAEAVYSTAIKNKLDGDFILPDKFGMRGLYSENFASWDQIPLASHFDCVTPSKDIAKTMDASSRDEITVNYINKWVKKMRTLPTYDKFKDDIETLKDILTCSAKTLDSIEKNIKLTWKE